jgi:hypothetical protein
VFNRGGLGPDVMKALGLQQEVTDNEDGKIETNMQHCAPQGPHQYH